METEISKCPFPHGAKPSLTSMPDRIRALPLDERGYPIPFFVAKVDGKHDFRVMDPEKWVRCINEVLCWVCGQRRGSYHTFALGPMCGINRTSAEPPSHLECALWSALNCPFLTIPKMKRREDEMTKEMEPNTAGIMIKRNPGVVVLWTTKQYGIFRDENNRPLINIGEPTSLKWFAEGRKATLAEVHQSIESGICILDEVAAKEGTKATEQLNKMRSTFNNLIDELWEL